MTAKYIVVEAQTQKLIDTSPTLPKLDPAAVAAVLGAKAAVVGATAQGPFTLFALRQELLRRLQSTGGRPGFADADKVAKVPVSAEQWRRLEELAAAVAEPGFSPSAGQVANVLLASALAHLGPDAVKALAKQQRIDPGAHVPGC